MKKLLVFSLFFFVAVFSGCTAISVLTGGYKPLIVMWPEVKQQSNVPQLNQGVVITAPRGVWLDIVKVSGYGTTAFIYGMPPGGVFFLSADADLQYGTTIVITVRGRDANGNLMGVTSRQFSFSETSYSSYNYHWNVRVSELQW